MERGEVSDERCADLILTPEAVTTALLKSFDQLAPFGMGNPKPTVALSNVLIERVAWFGKSSEHLRIHIAREGGTSVEAIAFFARRDLGKAPDSLSPGSRVSVLVYVELDQFTKGQPVRLRLLEIK
jgi:single-stranded-DNA-specific exonuclease